jgi:DMSO reductase anchor subunit
MRDTFIVLVNGAGFLGLMILLIWLLNPFLPGVHGIWQDILGLVTGFLFYWVVAQIYKAGKKKASDHSR